MTRLLAAAIIAVAMLTPGWAEDAPKPADITVQQALALGPALAYLGDHPEGDHMAVSALKFDGDVVWAMARNIESSNRVAVAYRHERDALIRHIFGQDQIPQIKDKNYSSATESEFEAQDQKMFEAPSGQLWLRIKFSDLCLDLTPKPPCKVTNSIPPGVLSSILPLVDK